MDLNQYSSRKQSLLTRALAALVYVFQQFLRGFITAREWNELTTVTYRVLKPFRDEATQLARQFYDDNRAAQQPDKDRHDIFTDDHYPIEWFKQEMRPVFDNLQKHQNVDAAVVEATARATKVIEDAQRRTLIQGVESDSSSRVRGWARFDPRPPTCAFCTILISRGPVYHTKSTAGGYEGAQDVLEKTILDGNQGDIDRLLNRWHPGCTCVVVPVYKYANYPSESQEEEARKIYEAGRKRAKAKGDLSTRMILNEMRKLIYKPAAGQDEVTLGRNVA